MNCDIQLLDSLEGYEHLPRYDFTALNAIEACPVYGIVRFIHHKQFESNERAMALEAGSAAHEAYAACRVLMLHEMGLPEHAQYHGKRIFGDKWEAIWSQYDERDDVHQRRVRVALEAFYQSGYYSDPRDTRRTTENLEASLVHYVENWNWSKPVWVEDRNDPTSKVGIEVWFNMLLSWDDGVQIIYCGRVDGIHVNELKGIPAEPQENKTVSRLGEAWSAGMQMTHQLTGYNVAATLFTGVTCERSIAIGLTLPLGKSYDPMSMEAVLRPARKIGHWLTWIRHIHSIVLEYKDNVELAPQYTHSCNRYFRPCPFIPLCASETIEEFKDTFENEMVVDVWDPTHDRTNTD